MLSTGSASNSRSCSPLPTMRTGCAWLSMARRRPISAAIPISTSGVFARPGGFPQAHDRIGREAAKVASTHLSFMSTDCSASYPLWISIPETFIMATNQFTGGFHVEMENIAGVAGHVFRRPFRPNRRYRHAARNHSRLHQRRGTWRHRESHERGHTVKLERRSRILPEPIRFSRCRSAGTTSAHRRRASDRAK